MNRLFRAMPPNDVHPDSQQPTRAKATQDHDFSKIQTYPWRYAQRASNWRSLRNVRVLAISWWGLLALCILFGVWLSSLQLFGRLSWPLWVSILFGAIVTEVSRRQVTQIQALVGSLNLFILELWTLLLVALLIAKGIPLALAEIIVTWNRLPLLPTITLQLSILQPLIWGWLGLAIVTIVSFPILFHMGLRQGFQLRPLRLKELEQYSPEAAKQLRQIFLKQQRLSLPELSVLPTQAPLTLSYGHLLRNSHIVVSQGLLDQLKDDEIAAIMAVEAGHLLNRVGWVLPWLVLLLQLPFIAYWQLATWGDVLKRAPTHSPQGQVRQRSYKGWQQGLRRLGFYSCAISSCLAYGVFKLLRWPLLFLSRQRLFYSDRQAANLTGNPNAIARALVKIALGTQATICQVGYTPALLESLELLLPVGYHGAIPISFATAAYPVETLLAWELANPYQGWLSLNNAHPALSDRLRILMYYAQTWNLQPEFELPLPANAKWHPQQLLQVRSLAQFRQFCVAGSQYWLPLLRQTLPYWGLCLGLGLGLSIQWLSGVLNVLGLPALSWLFQNPLVVWASLPLGIIFGLIIRSNDFFPEFRRLPLDAEPRPGQLLPDLDGVPLAMHELYWQGTLLGRSGLKNALHQDLWLRAPEGILRLHHHSILGAIPAFWRSGRHPCEWVGHVIRVRGWLRRSLTIWIDLESFQGKSVRGRTYAQAIKSTPELWALTLAALMLVWSFLTLLLGI
ncbi:MAG: M48 family metalloprotease [Cyanobacteria bacterium P01_H01_bin.121]